MPATTLSLYSEPYSPSGNVAADGVKKLLGAPRLDLLQTLVREAVQNSCDAANDGDGPIVQFRLRRLSEDQLEFMRSFILTELPDHDETSDPVRNFMSSDEPWVLEICDFGTTGLAGPTRADLPVAEGEHTDFVDFIRNVGSRRDTDLGGGTYGYGKSALYLASRCGLIVVDSETTDRGEGVRRLIAAQLGEAHDAGPDGDVRRYTGRHWWGCFDDEERFVEPLDGEDAAEFAMRMGLPERSSGDTGTSIMILDPQFVNDNLLDVIGALQEALLWHFWPRMMRDVPAARRLEVVVELDGAMHPVPQPEDVGPLDLFCQAMRGIRENEMSVQAVESQRPAAVLGHLNIVKGMRGERVPLRADGQSLFPETSRHIAVMRPVELVVRYFDGDPLPQAGLEWAGVFVSSHDPAIEKAFADSEPPAHDDWQPEMLERGTWARRYVKVALSRIKDAAKSVAGCQLQQSAGHRDGPSLAHVADLLGKALGSVNPQGAGPRIVGRGVTGSRRAFSVSRPVFERLQEAEDGLVACFGADIRNEGGARLELRLEPSLVIDGAAAGAEIEGYQMPEVLQVVSASGETLGVGSTISIADFAGSITILVSMPDDGAVMVKGALAEVEP
jgi:hypothetical protein